MCIDKDEKYSRGYMCFYYTTTIIKATIFNTCFVASFLYFYTTTFKMDSRVYQILS